MEALAQAQEGARLVLERAAAPKRKLEEMGSIHKVSSFYPTL